jgi:hypothetical protein
LSDILLPSAFLEAGATYRLADPMVTTEGAAGTYRLAEVELSGDVRDLGTHEIQFAVPPPLEKPGRLSTPVRPS